MILKADHHLSLSYFENNIFLGIYSGPKVFAKVKNGQKKCPISENPMIFVKQDFPKWVLYHNAFIANFFI